MHVVLYNSYTISAIIVHSISYQHHSHILNHRNAALPRLNPPLSFPLPSNHSYSQRTNPLGQHRHELIHRSMLHLEGYLVLLPEQPPRHNLLGILNMRKYSPSLLPNTHYPPFISLLMVYVMVWLTYQG